MKSLRTKRDEQQWILDLAINMSGRVQNFERDDWETPTRAHNYRMLPKMWVIEDQFHPLWGIPNLGKLDCHHYIMDWLQHVLFSEKPDHGVADGRIAYITYNGDGPWGNCEWEPPISANDAYF